jgi:hypothetical protein
MSLEEQPISQDEVFDLLSSPRRRYVLYYLRDTGGEIDLTTLAEEVAAWENETAVEDLTQQERKRVYVSLYQTHIPRLVDAGLVDHDTDAGTVTLGEEAGEIDRYLQNGSSTHMWQWVYLGLAVASAGVFAVVTVSGLDVADSTLIVGFLSLFLLTSVAHTVHRTLTNRSIPSELRDRL